MPKYERIVIRCDEDLKRKFKMLSAKKGMCYADLLKFLINYYERGEIQFSVS